MSNNNDEYTWTDNPTVSGVSPCNTDVLNECLMHLKYNNEGSGTGLSIFDVVEKDHILSLEESKGFAPLGSFVYKEPASSSRYGYPDFYAKCLEEKTDGLEVELQLEENTITVYKNMNGHIFYDIADKDAVDLYYLHNGACWMYGIDTENERIFLPRNDWFTMSGKTDEVGKFVEAGLPNITGAFDRANRNGAGAATGAFSNGTGQGGYARDGARDSSLVNFDASASSPIYGKSDTVQPAAVKQLLYMVVGNTEKTVSADIDVITQVTTSENDTIPLFTAQYFNFTPNNPSWLKAGEQKNSGGIYTTAYNTLVACLTENTYNIKVVDVTNMTAGVDYSQYWKVDQTAMTFTTPLKVGNEGIFGNVPVIGNGKALGLTDGTTNYGLGANNTGQTYYTMQASTSDYGLAVGVDTIGGVSAGRYRYGITTDPENSGLVTDTSGAEVPEGWGLYFKIANAVENLALIDTGEILDTLADKVNMTNTQWATGACMPDYSAGVTISSFPFTAPVDCLLQYVQYTDRNESHWYVNNVEVALYTTGANGVTFTGNFLLKKGDVVTQSGGSSGPGTKYFALKGANND